VIILTIMFMWRGPWR